MGVKNNFMSKPATAICAVVLIVLIVAGFVLFLLWSAQPRTLIVPDQYSTIQQAIDAARSGDTIIIHAGVYSESLVLKDGISLSGDGMDSVTIRTEDESASVISVSNCPKGLIRGLALEYTGDKSEKISTIGISISNSSIQVAECKIMNMPGDGIKITGESQPLIRDCIIESNHRIR